MVWAVVSKKTINLAVCRFYNSSVTIGALAKGSHTIDFSVTTDNDGLAAIMTSLLLLHLTIAEN
jgi:hypothetical protein